MRRPTITLLTLLLALCGSTLTLADPLALETTGHYQLRVGETLDEGAVIYKITLGVPHFLIVSDKLESPWLIKAVERVARPLAPDAVLPDEADPELVKVSPPESEADEATIRIEGTKVSFRSPQGLVTMEPREPLVGELTPEQMFDYMPEYRRAASAFEPSKGQLRLLAAVEKEVEVDVYFGTWCPHCEKLVPRMIKLASLVDNPKVRFTFRGVPGKIADDPMARQYKVEGVPVALVRSGGEVLARLQGRDLIQPETSLNAALLGADS